MKKVAVLGAGLIGRTIAIDLYRNGHEVSCYDLNLTNLNLIPQNINVARNQVNLMSLDFNVTLKSHDLVISAVPGFMGYKVLKNIIEAKKDCVDISFFAEDYSDLQELADKNNVKIVVDCGIAPGMSNLILGRESQNMTVKKYKFSVGGLPQTRIPPFEYKAPYSPTDVIEFYTRPVRARENGIDVIKKPLSDIEDLYVDSVGKLEAFETDGLRSLLKSFPHIPNLCEKTIRYPGHATKIDMLKEMGFFKKENIEYTSKVLIDEWKMTPEDKDMTIMIAEIEGVDELGETKKISYSLIDKHDGEFHSMARCTAFTCVAMSELMIMGFIEEFGIHPPENIGKDADSFEFILNYLKKKNVNWIKQEQNEE